MKVNVDVDVLVRLTGLLGQKEIKIKLSPEQERQLEQALENGGEINGILNILFGQAQEEMAKVASKTILDSSIKVKEELKNYGKTTTYIDKMREVFLARYYEVSGVACAMYLDLTKEQVWKHAYKSGLSNSNSTTSRHNRNWTQKEIELFWLLIEKGFTRKKIAHALRRKLGGIRNKIKELRAKKYSYSFPYEN